MSLVDDLNAVAQAGAKLSLRASQLHRVNVPLPQEAVLVIRAESAALRAALDRLDQSLAIQAPTDPGLCHSMERPAEDWASYRQSLGESAK
jgi:hypothetical protein